MKMTTFGNTDLEVSTICFGTWQAGGDWGEVDQQGNIAAIRKARELGINFFDTAQGYGFGVAEKMLGEALRDELDSNRDEIVIATKGGLRPDGDDLLRDSSEKWLREGIESSLGALGVDHVDLYQIHWPDSDTDPEQLGQTLQALIDEGKTRHVGVSNYDAAQIAELSASVTVASLQPPFHMFQREIEAETLPYCREHGVAVLPYGPMAHGLLTGRFDADTKLDSGDWRSGSPDFQGESYERNLAVVARLGEIADELGWTLAQLAIAWDLSTPGVDSVIAGARSAEHIEGTAAAGELELSASDRERIDAILVDAVSMQGPSPEM